MAARLLRRLSHLPNEVDDYSCLNIAPCSVHFGLFSHNTLRNTA